MGRICSRRVVNDILERHRLLYKVLDAGDGPQDTLGQLLRVQAPWHIEDTLLNLGGEAQENEYLGNPCPRQPFSTCDCSLARYLASVEFPPPLEGLAEGLDHGRRPGHPGRLGPPGAAGAFGGGADDLAAGNVAYNSADVAILKGSFGAQRDLDHLFAMGGRIGGSLVGDMADAEADFRLGPLRPGSNTGTFGEPDRIRTLSRWLTTRPA